MTGRAEFQAAMRGRGIEVPDDLLDGCYSVHLELQRMAALIRTERPPEMEPAPVFSALVFLPPEQ